MDPPCRNEDAKYPLKAATSATFCITVTLKQKYLRSAGEVRRLVQLSIGCVSTKHTKRWKFPYFFVDATNLVLFRGMSLIHGGVMPWNRFKNRSKSIVPSATSTISGCNSKSSLGLWREWKSLGNSTISGCPTTAIKPSRT